MTTPPLVVLDVATDAELEPAALSLARAGWSVRSGLDDVPLTVDRLVCRGVVDGAASAASAVLAGTWGSGLLLATGTAPPEVVAGLLDDLGRLGPVRRSNSTTGSASGPSATSAELLDLLLDGHSLKDAAAALFLSRRTADRRLAQAREQLGVDSTAEALVTWARRRDQR